MDGAVRSEPEGVLFATRSDTVRVGTALLTPSLGSGAYWTVNGVPQRDALGRAIDIVSLPMPNSPLEVVAHTAATTEDRDKLYWYGSLEVSMDSDTDVDGLTFAEELANGTNPLFADGCQSGLIVCRDGETHEVNLQPYERVDGAVVDDRYAEWPDFGRGVKPVVADVNGDGLWDLVVCTVMATNVYLNIGSKGSPAFELESEAGERIEPSVLEMNSTGKLATMVLDAEPVNALSATAGKDTLLVSDTEGRIWYYTSSTPETYTLNHKVWGGSFAGFAEGLQLAAVDWEDDGDLDCLCGTADGRLFLLRNPKVGRPTNLQALVGVDNVLLTWDPNAQSRIRGYKVYRGAGPGEGELRIAETQLPTYRDRPGTIKGYDYAVSSVSRFYTAGNSTPTVTESPRSEPVHADLGRVALHWTDATAKVGELVTVMLSIDNSANLSPEMTIALDYDKSKLRLLKEVKSALFEGDKIASGSGKLYEYIFDVVATEPCETEVHVTGAALKGVNGAAVSPILPEKAAVVTIAAVSSRPPYRLGDLTGDGVVDEADIRLLAKLKVGTGRKCTAQQLKAGDLNGNGRLDNADYQALRAMVYGGED